MQHFQTLTRLQYHKHLNQRIFNDDVMKPAIRNHLLLIAKRWEEYAKIPPEAIIDYTTTGGNMNYNYSPLSDIDVHILVDPTKMPIKDEDFQHDYIMAKKNLWAQTHNVTVLGYDVELYAQPITEPTAGNQGVYSLLNNSWITHPLFLNIKYTSPALKAAVHSYIAKIDQAVQANDVEKSREIKQSIVDGRAEGLRQEGSEFAQGNLIFKALRNTGDLAKLSNFIIHHEDRALSYGGRRA